jgi:cytochrome c oxidase subunit 1
LQLAYLNWSLFRGERAPANPWGATGLEWKTQSPPLTENFDETPVVTDPPYNYPSPEVVQGHV